MSAALRCACARCNGGVIYTHAEDYLMAHQALGPDEFVLDREVAVIPQRPRGQLAVIHPSPRSLFADDLEV